MALAEATVRVTLEVTRFEEQLRKDVQNAAQQAGKDADKELKSQFEAAGQHASDSFKSSLVPGMEAAGAEAIATFEKGLGGDATGVGSRVGNQLADSLRTPIVNAGEDAAKGFVTNVGTVLENSGEDVGKQFVDSLATGMSSGALKAGEDAAAAIGKGAGPGASTAGKNAGKSFADGFNANFIANNPLIAAGVALGAAFTQPILQSLGILAAVPTALLSVAGTAGVVVTAFHGIGDAIKAVGAGDLDKLETALGKLSPQAQAFVRSFAAIRPVLDDVQASIQDAFFGQLQGQLENLSTTLTGPLRGALVSVSTAAGSLTKQFVSTFTSFQGSANLTTLFTNTSTSILQIGPALATASRGLLSFVAAGAPGLNTLGQSLAGLLNDLGDFLSTSANSGKALSWVESGVTGIKNLASGIGDLVKSLLVVFNALQPVAFGFTGLLGVAETLINEFGKLPAPLQAAALAVALFTKSGLPKFLKQSSDETGPLTKAINDMGAAYQTASSRVGELQVATAAGSSISSGLTRAFDSISGAASSFGNTLRSGVITNLNLVDSAVSNASASLQNGFSRSLAASSAALTQAAAGIDSRLVPAALAIDGVTTQVLAEVEFLAEGVRSKLISAADTAVGAVGNLSGALQTGLIRGTLAAESAVSSAGNAINNFSTAIQTGFIRASNATGSAVQAVTSAVGNFSTAIQTGFIRGSLEAQSAATSLSTAIQTGIIRVALQANTVLDSVGATLKGGVLSGLFNVTSAYRTASTQVQEFAQAQQVLSGTLGQSTPFLTTLRNGFTNLTAVTAGSGAALKTAFAGPLAAVGAGMNSLGATAVGLGKALVSGLGSAVNGIVSALGGPFGIAIAAAGVVLSLLTQQQQQAAQAAAAHDAALADLAATLNKTTGAVTSQTTALAASKFAQNDVGAAAKALGINLGDVVQASTGNVAAQTALQSALHSSAAAALQQSDQWGQLQAAAKNLGLSTDTLIDAFLGNSSALVKLKTAADGSSASYQTILSWGQALIPNQKTLGSAVGDTSSSLADQAQKIAAAAAAMTPAQITASKFSDALIVLADKTSDADTKARALTDALNILAGGTIPAEQAQAKFTDLIKQLSDQLDTSTKGLNDQGAAMLTTTGRINTSTQAGAFLVDTYSQLQGALTTSTAATIAAGQANGDLDGALKTVAGQAQTARDSFVNTATQLGLTKAQANQLADAYGLIPAQVLTTVTDQGSAQNVQLQIAGVDQRIKDLPPNTDVRVSGLTDDAIQKLKDVGVTVTAIPNSKDVTVNAKTGDAVSALQKFVNSFSGTVINFVANLVTGKSAGGIVGNARGNILGMAKGGTLQPSMPANRAEIVPPNTWRVIGDRAIGDEAFIPINTSARSEALLAETARRMGFALFAGGAVLGGDGASTLTPSVSIAPGAIVIQAPNADPELVARATLNAVAREAVG